MFVRSAYSVCNAIITRAIAIQFIIVGVGDLQRVLNSGWLLDCMAIAMRYYQFFFHAECM